MSTGTSPEDELYPGAGQAAQTASAEELGVSIAKAWYASVSGGRGMANTGLVMAEHFAENFPLEAPDYIAPGGGQVAGLNGAHGNRIISRFEPALATFGTESGRTSRGTPDAARQLAKALNDRADVFGGLDSNRRRSVADAIQRWLVDGPIRGLHNRNRLRIEYFASLPTTVIVQNLLAAAQERKMAGCVAQHLIGAKLQLRFPEMKIENFGCSTADTVTGRWGDFQIADTAFHVTVAPAMPLISKCRDNLRDGLRPTLIVPTSKMAGAVSNLESEGLLEQVTVYSIEAFVAQNIEEMSQFDGSKYRSGLRGLLEEYNRRVMAVEADKSIMVQLPASLK